MNNLTFTIHLKDYVTSVCKKISTAFENLQTEVNKTSSTTSKFQSVCERLKMPQLSAQLQVFGQIGEAFSSACETGMNFGQAMADLSSITGIAGEELEQLSQSSRRIGAESGLGAATAARAYSLLASQIEISKIGLDGLNLLQEKSVVLSQASGMSLDAAANALAATVNQFGLGAEEADRVINVLAAGSKYGAAEIEDLSQSFKVVGAAASAMGLTVEQTAGALEILSQANLKGSEAGTALRNIILKLNTELGVDLGETSLGKALDELKPKLTDATYLSKVFGMENIAAAQFLIQNASAVDEMTAQLTGTSVAAEQASVRTNTTAQKMAVLRAQVEDLKIGLVSATGTFAPYITLLAENSNLLILCGQVGKVFLSTLNMLSAGYRKARTAILAFTTAQKGTAIATALTTVHEKVQTIALNLLTASSWTATAGFTALRAATIALYAALSLGITLIIHGLISLFSSLGDEAEETTEQIDHLAQAQETFRSTAADARASIDMEISKLRELITTQGDETEAVRSLNERYGEIFGKHESAAEWYETLIAKSAAYCAQLGYEAQARQIAARKAELEMKRDEKARQRSQVNMLKPTLWRLDGINPEWEALNQEVNRLEQEIETCATAFDTCVKNMQQASADLAKGISSGAVAATQSIGWQQMSYAELGQEIRRTKERLEELMGVDAAAAAKQQQLLDAQTRRYEALGKQYGLIKGDTTPSSGLPTKAATPATDNSTGNGGLYGSDLKDLLGDAATIARLEDAIRHYREMQRNASADEIADIQTTINLLEGKRQKLLDLANPPQTKSFETPEELIESQEALKELQELTGKPLTIELQAIGLEEIRAKIRSLQGLLDDPMNPLSEKDAQGVNENIKAWQGYEQSLIQAQSRGKMVQDAVRNMGSIMSSLSGVVGQGAAGWLQYGANILSAVAEAIPSITQMIAANTAQAYSGAAAQSQTVPFPYNLIALAASMASVTAAVLSIPKFANGGIAYGPTLGIFGEYAGASSNPEVVAPLDRLRDIIGETSSGRDGLSGKVEFSIKNRRLYAALRNEEKYRRRM